MIDLSTRTIQKLFNQQIQQLTERTVIANEDLFDFQMSGGWM